MVFFFVASFSALTTQDFVVVFAIGCYVVRFTAISTFAYCVPVSVSAFNDGPLVLALLLLLLLGVSRPGVLETAGRRFCYCRLRTDDRGGNPRFDINRYTSLSERSSPSFANAASSTAPLRNVNLLSLFPRRSFGAGHSPHFVAVCRIAVSLG